jgi:hypothetical protein
MQEKKMTNAIIMSSLFPIAVLQRTDGQVKDLIEKARKNIEIAKQESVFCNAASISNADKNNIQLVSIAGWHLEKSLRHFRAAISNLEQAKKFKLSAKYKKYVETKIIECYTNTKLLTESIHRTEA